MVQSWLLRVAPQNEANNELQTFCLQSSELLVALAFHTPVTSVAASQPPPSVVIALPRTTPWRAPAYEPAQPASGRLGPGPTAAALGSPRATPHHTVVRASRQASEACVERARRRAHIRRPRQPTRRLAPHCGARQRTRQRSPRRASTMAASQPPPSVAAALPRTTPWRAPARKPARERILRSLFLSKPPTATH